MRLSDTSGRYMNSGKQQISENPFSSPYRKGAKTERFPLLFLVALLQIAMSGCASMFQDPDMVLIREPGNRTYNPPVSISASAKELWEYAVLSENVYTVYQTPQRKLTQKLARQTIQDGFPCLGGTYGMISHLNPCVNTPVK
jgi:hypothetical protein